MFRIFDSLRATLRGLVSRNPKTTQETDAAANDAASAPAPEAPVASTASVASAAPEVKAVAAVDDSKSWETILAEATVRGGDVAPGVVLAAVDKTGN